MAGVRAIDARHTRREPAAASFQPAAGRDPGAEVRAAEAVTQELWRAVQAFSLDAVTPESEAAFEALSRTLVPYLDVAQFLWLHVTSRGFRVHKAFLSADSEPLARHLAQGGVVELLFKRGVTRYELERCVGALSESAADGVHSAATRLWEAALSHVVFRCRDEFLGPDDERGDLESWRSQWPEGSSAVEHEDLVHEFETADGAATVGDWEPLVAFTSEDRTSLQRLRLMETEVLAERLARHLARLHDREREAVLRGESLGLLGDVVEMLLSQRKFPLLRDMLVALREEQDGRAASEATLDHVAQRLCSERNVILLGEVLEDRRARPDDARAVREILVGLPGAIDPLCRMLVRLEDLDARRLTCRVLAFVAKEDPRALAQRAVGQPWYLARNVAYVLGRIGGSRVLPFLKRWTRHDDDRVRMEVARALGRVREPGAVDLLGGLLDDASWRVRQSAVWALAGLRDVRALPLLRQILFEDRGFRSRRSEERDDFFRTYGRLADRNALDELVRIVERQILVVGWQSDLRRGAVLALGETGRPEALRALVGLERVRDARLRDAVAESVCMLRNRPASTLASDDLRDVPAPAARVPRNVGVFRLEVAEEGGTA